jgi:branched-subunit amino acid aminotransferase/4-amino-4-deoxychorismate lyase
MIFNYAILNGKLLPVDQARIPIFNKALLSSFGVYETMKVERGRPFYLQEHFLRLLNSAEMIDLELGVDIATLTGWFERLVKVDPQATWVLRILALGAVEAGASPIIAMWPEIPPTYPDTFYHNGAAAILYEGQRAIPACKSLNALVNYLARREAIRAGALEGLLHHNGYLTEGARSNIFAVRQGQLITPPASEVLSGITRDVILRVMQKTTSPVVEAPIPVDVSLYEEFFISSTSMHVMPITQIDDQPVGDGRVGPITKMVMARFEARYRQTMNLTSS